MYQPSKGKRDGIENPFKLLNVLLQVFHKTCLSLTDEARITFVHGFFIFVDVHGLTL